MEDFDSPTFPASDDWSKPRNAQSFCNLSVYPMPPSIKGQTALTQEAFEKTLKKEKWPLARV